MDEMWMGGQLCGSGLKGAGVAVVLLKMERIMGIEEENSSPCLGTGCVWCG